MATVVDELQDTAHLRLDFRCDSTMVEGVVDSECSDLVEEPV